MSLRIRRFLFTKFLVRKSTNLFFILNNFTLLQNDILPSQICKKKRKIEGFFFLTFNANYWIGYFWQTVWKQFSVVLEKKPFLSTKTL